MVAAPWPVLPVIEKVSPRERPTLSGRSYEAAVKIPDLLIGAYELPRGSIFMEDPAATGPYAFTVNLPDRTRAYLVVARELGDLEYPVTLRHHRRMVTADVKLVVARGLLDVLAWVKPTPTRSPQRRLA